MKKIIISLTILSLFMPVSADIKLTKKEYDKFADETKLCTNFLTTSTGYLQFKVCMHEQGSVLHKQENVRIIFKSTTNAKKLHIQEQMLSIITDDKLFKHQGEFKNDEKAVTTHDVAKEISNSFFYGTLGALKDEYKTSYTFTTTTEIPLLVVQDMVSATKTEGKIGEIEFKTTQLSKKSLAEFIHEVNILPLLETELQE